jgi:SAM-dependent methyltransferase
MNGPSANSDMSNLAIPTEESHFHPLSFGDSNGRLFSWKGDLYRGITDKAAPHYQRLFESGTVERLVEKELLIETDRTPFTMGDYGLVLKHRRVPFVSYACEWCPEMLKAAALTVLDMEIELAAEGLTLQDAHPWNVLFDGCRPVFIDFGSIVAAHDNALWPAYDEFCQFFTSPLELMARGHGRIARWLLHDYDQGVLNSDLVALVGKPPLGAKSKRLVKSCLSSIKRRVPQSYRPALRKGFALFKSTLPKIEPKTNQPKYDFLQQVRREVEAITLPTERTEWSDYYDREFPSFSPSSDWTPKHHNVFSVLSELRPSTVLDIGSNRGWYSQMAAHLGINAVAFDVDEACAAQLFNEAKEKDLPILPLVMDFRNPSPGYGLCNNWLAPATQRLKCDLVMALALVHHLVFKRQLNFEQIVDGLSVFADRWLLVEFVPREDKYVSEWWSEDYSWYTLEKFEAALKLHYQSIRILPSNLDPRVLLICEKR